LFGTSNRRIGLKEVFMNCFDRLRAALLFSILFASTAACAQSEPDEIGSLPTALTGEQLQLMTPFNSVAVPEPSKPRARQQLPIPVLLLTPEEISYREAVRILGVNKYHYVHCELPGGKVRTGLITEIGDDGFTLKDGIIISQRIPYADLQAAPRRVPAVGTRIGKGFKWVGVGLGVAALIPLFPFAFLVWDGC
jgi:hypothetical protein